MKKLTYIIMFMLAAGVFIPATSKSQVIISVRPERHVDPHYVRPVAPGPHHIWVEGEWRWDEHDRRYVEVPGYWVEPREGWVWVPGHWGPAPGGEEWHAGHWSRRY